MDSEFIAGFFVYLGSMFVISGLLGALFPALFRNRKTGEIPDRNRMVTRNIWWGCICYLIVVMLL